MSDDLFDVAVTDVERDRWDRPLIWLPGEGPADPKNPTQEELGRRVPYMRASTLAGKAGSGLGISIWKGRHIALAVARNEDIAAVIAGLEYGSGRLDTFIADALERAKMSEPANWGTAVHLFTEPVNKGKPVPRRLKHDVASYQDELDRTGVQVIETELFVVNDDLQVAGTFDHLYLLPAGMLLPDKTRVPARGMVVVGDKKTGKLHPMQIGVQLSTYANGWVYDVESGDRTPLHELFSTKWGISVYIPLGKADTEFGFLDLVSGYEVAHATMRINRQEREEKRLITRVPSLNDVPVLSEALQAEIAALAAQARQETVAGRAPIEAYAMPWAQMEPTSANRCPQCAIDHVRGDCPPIGTEVVPREAANPERPGWVKRGGVLRCRCLRTERMYCAAPKCKGGADIIALERASAAPEPAEPKPVMTKGQVDRLIDQAFPIPAQRESAEEVPEPRLEEDQEEALIQPPTYAERIAQATSRGDLSVIWKEAQTLNEWTPALAKLGQERLTEILAVKA